MEIRLIKLLLIHETQHYLPGVITAHGKKMVNEIKFNPETF